MRYREDKYGNRLSVMGYGCMRFTRKINGVDLKKTEQEILTAFRGGINYYDTAYIYPGSEAALGAILEKHRIRDQIYIATKLPHYMIRKPEDMDKYFDEQLKRLRIDYVDYYLMHMLTDVQTWERLKDLGITEWIREKKKTGAIRQIGFSYHGNSDMFCQLLDVYDWDFCQIQYNYMDEHSQAGRTGLNYAGKKGIPVVIMEPLRGGKLVNHLPAKAAALFDRYPVKRSPAEWSFLWLWDQPEVTCVLSGMNSIDMVKENIQSASRIPNIREEAKEMADCFETDTRPRSSFEAATRQGLSPKANSRPLAACHFLEKRDKALLKKVAQAINARMKVPCTGCRYCMPCPRNVDIPGTFSAYNRKYTDSRFEGQKDYIMCTLIRKEATSASRCVKCGKCEQHCPQGIAIRKELEGAVKELEGPVYKIASKVLPRFMKY